MLYFINRITHRVFEAMNQFWQL